MNRRHARVVVVALAATMATALAAGSAVANDPSASPSAASPSGVPGSMGPVAPDVGLTVEGAWARASQMMGRAGAAYMVIRSQATTDDALIGVTSPAAAVVEMHRTEADASGMMSMHQVPEIVIPAGGSVELAPGGLHLMLIDLVAPLVDGTDVELVLTFQSGATLTVHAQVGSGAPMASGMPMGSGMPMSSPGPMGSGMPMAPMASPAS